MKRRIIGFLVGAAMGIGTAYLTRRFLNSQKTQASLPAPAPTKPVTEAPKSGETETESSPRQSVKYTVRRTGPRPESTADGSKDEAITEVKASRSTEPPAATETDEAATSPRSETFEPIEVPQAEFEPAHTQVADEAPKAEESTVEEVQPKAKTEDAETASSEAKDEEDNLEVILGIGEVFNRRLLESGITTFEALAALSPAEIAEKTGIPQDRIERDDWLSQAKELAEAAKSKKTRKSTAGKAANSDEEK